MGDAPTVLLTNDDGIHAPGLWALYEALTARFTVTVVAPDRERSAVGHGISLHTPLRADAIQINGGARGYAVNGTPADCIKIGITEILARRPRLVLSGINPGANVGVNVNYSGTVAAAREAALFGVPAIAVSVAGPVAEGLASFGPFVAALAARVLQEGLPFGTLLNVNFPARPLNAATGVSASHQGITRLWESFVKRTDPRNRTYYWPGSDPDGGQRLPGSDGQVLQDGRVSITPLQCDMTDYGTLERIRSWELEGLLGAGRGTAGGSR